MNAKFSNNPELETNQKIILCNEFCMFYCWRANIKGSQLEGAGLIVPKKHRETETAFDLTIEEWNATHSLLQDVKRFLDEKYQPQGYNLGWNCGEIGGKHVFSISFHVIPRYADELLADISSKVQRIKEMVVLKAF